MNIRLLTSEQDLRRYSEWVLTHPQGSLWQSLEWRRFQEASGREVRVYGSGKMKDESGKCEATALVVIDRTAGGFSTWEIPRGPLISGEWRVESGKWRVESGEWKVESGEWRVESGKCEELLGMIITDAKKDTCLALYLSPLSPLSSLSTFHFPLSTRRVHAEATRIIDLTKTEEEILAQMHPKGRYNITLARKHGIEVRESTVSDANAFYELLRSTAEDRFRISQQSHYTRFLSDLDGSFMLMAKHQGKPVAGLIGVVWNGTGIYYYGASSYEYRNLMAPSLLQWEAMRYCKAQGCNRYDLLGVEKEAEDGKSSWKGLSDFKRKFGGAIITYPPEQILVLRPMTKGLLEWKRKVLG